MYRDTHNTKARHLHNKMEISLGHETKHKQKHIEHTKWNLRRRKFFFFLSCLIPSLASSLTCPLGSHCRCVWVHVCLYLLLLSLLLLLLFSSFKLDKSKHFINVNDAHPCWNGPDWNDNHFVDQTIFSSFRFIALKLFFFSSFKQ